MRAINFVIRPIFIINFLLVNIVLLVFSFFMLLKLSPHLQVEILAKCLYVSRVLLMMPGRPLDEICNHFRKTTKVENHCVHIFKNILIFLVHFLLTEMSKLCNIKCLMFLEGNKGPWAICNTCEKGMQGIVNRMKRQKRNWAVSRMRRALQRKRLK